MSNRRALAKATKESREPKPVAKPKDIIYDPAGQWKFPGQPTRIPSNEITMDSVNYPVWAVPNVGQPTMMQPGSYHTFPGAKYVDEYPQMAEGGMVEPIMDENGEPMCPDGYTYNSSTGYCEKSSVGCPDGYEIDPETGKCIEGECKPGYVKNQVGNCVPDINTLKEMYPIEGYSEWENDKGEKGKTEIRTQEFVDKASQTCPPNHFYDQYQGKCVRYYTKEEAAGWTKFPEELSSHKNYNNYLKSLKDQWVDVQGDYWDPISNKYITGYVPGENFEDSRISQRIPKPPEKILTEQVARTERLIPEYDQPKLELKKNKLPGFGWRDAKEDGIFIRKWNPFNEGSYDGFFKLAPYSAALRMFTGYDKGDTEKQLKKEIQSAKEEGRPINFKGIPLMGKSDLKQRRSYKNAIKDYNEREKKLEEQNQKREDEYNKAMIEYNNYMLEEEAKRKASGLESDKYGGSTLEYKRGGINSRSFSRSLEATNRFFAESKLFKKPKKLSKKRIYDPAAKYYQAGGVTYNNLPPTYLTALRNFVYPNAIDDPERTGYNSANSTINYDSQSPIENMSNDWWREHELFHDLQNQAGGMSTSGVVGQRPNPYVASDESMQGYYDRRDADVERTIDSMIAQNPDLQFIPRHKLAEGAGPGFIGAEDLQYADPSTLEGEARQYEQYIKEGNPSIFPKKQNGGTNRTKLSNKEEQAFKKFYDTLPENLQTDDDTYDIRGYWDALGRPQEFDYSQPTESDGYYHAFSINPNTGEYLKSPAHPTFQHAIDEDRKIGYRPITNVYGRNIATEVPSIADPEEQSFLRNTEGPINYIELDLSPEEIEQYKKGGYIVEDISVPSLNTYQRGGSPCGRGKYMNEKGECVSLDWNTVDLASDYDIGPQWTNNRSWENQNGQHISNINAIKVNAPARSRKLSDWILRGGRTRMQEMQDFGKKYSSEFGLGYNEPLIAANTTKEGVKKFKKYVKDAVDAQNKYYKKQTKIANAEEEKRQEYEKARKKAQSSKDLSAGTKFRMEYEEKGWDRFDSNKMNEAYKGQFQEAVNEANKRKEANMGVTNTALELLGGGAYRIVADPVGTAKGVAKTVADVATLPQGLAEGVVNYTNTGNFDMGTNVLTGENYGSGLDQTFDILGAIPGITAISKLGRMTKAGNLVGDFSKSFKNMQRAPGPMMLLGPSGSGNMVKKNMNYYKQLLDSYDAKKMSSANRKFYNDLINTAKKQDGMVTEAQLRELDRLKTGNFDFGKRGYSLNFEEILKLPDEDILSKTGKSKEDWELFIEAKPDKYGKALEDTYNSAYNPTQEQLANIEAGKQQLLDFYSSGEYNRRLQNALPGLSFMDAHNYQNSLINAVNKTKSRYVKSKNSGTLESDAMAYSAGADASGTKLGIDFSSTGLSRPDSKYLVSHEYGHTSLYDDKNRKLLENLPKLSLDEETLKNWTKWGKESGNKVYDDLISYYSSPDEARQRGISAILYSKEAGISIDDLVDMPYNQVIELNRAGKIPKDVAELRQIYDQKELKDYLKKLYSIGIPTTGLVGTATMLANPFQGSDGLQQQKKGGITDDYIEMDIPKSKVQWYIDNGYDVEILD